MLANVNPETIKDLASARVTIQLLLNLVEELSSANQGLREEVQGLRDEVNRLKQEQNYRQGMESMLAKIRAKLGYIDLEKTFSSTSL